MHVRARDLLRFRVLLRNDDTNQQQARINIKHPEAKSRKKMDRGRTQSKSMVGAVTPQMYEEVLGEVDTVTEELNKVRRELWETQDDLKEAKVYRQKVKQHEKICIDDKETIKTLELKFGNSLTKERDTRDALDLMKKVFTRTQLKARDDQTAIQKLKETNRLLVEENINLLQSLNAAQEELSGAETTTKNEKDIAEKLLFENYESIEVGKKLADKLKETKRELENERANQKSTAENNQASEKRMEANNRIAEEAATKIEEQQKEIKKLKKQLMAVKEHKEVAEGESEVQVDSSDAGFFSQLGFAAFNPCLTTSVAV